MASVPTEEEGAEDDVFMSYASILCPHGGLAGCYFAVTYQSKAQDETLEIIVFSP